MEEQEATNANQTSNNSTTTNEILGLFLFLFELRLVPILNIDKMLSERWMSFFRACDIPTKSSESYSMRFIAERIQPFLLADFTKDDLENLGIKPYGDKVHTSYLLVVLFDCFLYCLTVF